MHSSPASQTHCTSVVVNMHSNIPACDFTIRNETKEESKQAAGAAAPKTVQLAKHSASSSSQVKALDEESPTIVTPTLTVIHQSRPSPSEDTAVMTARLGRAEQELHSNSDEVTSSIDEVPPWGSSHAASIEANTMVPPPLVTEHYTEVLKSKSPSKAEALMKTKDIVTGIETQKVTRDPIGPEGDDRAGKTIHSVQVESAARGGPSGIRTFHLTTEQQESRCDPSGYRAANEQEEAASAQAVKRGHQVQIKEIPDDKDDTSFRLNQKTNQIPSVVHEETQLTVAEPLDSSAKTEKVPYKWLKPFEAEWTL